MNVTFALISARAGIGMVLMGLALAAGALATVYNLRQCRGPKEKTFTIKVCTASWLYLAWMLACAYCLPSPYRFVSTVLFMIVAPFLIDKWATTHQLIRMIEQKDELED